MLKTYLRKVAVTVRAEFESGSLDRTLLRELYLSFRAVPDIDRFLELAAKSFPAFNCGLTSVYLQYRLGCGEVVQGSYGVVPHTVLLLPRGLILDITADQFGGPKTYIGRLHSPWRLPNQKKAGLPGWLTHRESLHPARHHRGAQLFIP